MKKQIIIFGLIAILFAGVGDTLYFQDKQADQIESLSKDIKGLTGKLSDMNILYSSALSEFGFRVSQMEQKLEQAKLQDFGCQGDCKGIPIRTKGG